MQPNDRNVTAGAPEGAEVQSEGWEPEDFDHFTDLGLVRVWDDYQGPGQRS